MFEQIHSAYGVTPPLISGYADLSFQFDLYNISLTSVIALQMAAKGSISSYTKQGIASLIFSCRYRFRQS
jgi:hypothetical protein